MAAHISASTPLETMQDDFGSVAWVSEQLSNPLPIDMDFDEKAWFNAESKRISDVITKLENGMVSRKDKEIDQLKAQLARKNAELLHLVARVVNFKRYLVWENKEFGNFIGNLVEIGRKNFSPTGPVVNVGPFEDENEVDEFLKTMKELSMKMTNGVDKRSYELLAKINGMLLKSKGSDTPAHPTGAASATSSFTVDTVMDTVPDNGGSSTTTTTTTNQATAFILTPGMPNRAIPACRGADYNSTNVFTLPERNELNLINSSVTNFKHGIDLTKLETGYFCMCGVKLNSAESLGQHLIVSAKQ